MSQQPPLTPPSPEQPPGGGQWAPYDAPAWGASAPEQQPGPPSHPVPEQYRAAWGAPNHPMATTSLVLGIAGLVGVLLSPFLFVSWLAGIASPFAIWTGARARREIRANPRAHGGEGMATAGLVLGIIGLVLAVVLLVVVLAVAALFVALLTGAASA